MTSLNYHVTLDLGSSVSGGANIPNPTQPNPGPGRDPNAPGPFIWRGKFGPDMW